MWVHGVGGSAASAGRGLVMVTRRQDLVESDGLVFVVGGAPQVHDHVPWMLRLEMSVRVLVVTFDPPWRLLVHDDDRFPRPPPDGFFEDAEPRARAPGSGADPMRASGRRGVVGFTVGASGRHTSAFNCMPSTD